MSDGGNSGFRSYVDEYELESIDLAEEDRTTFLSGETIVSEAHEVLQFLPLSSRKRAIFGVLTITTFKLSFASIKSKSLTNDYYQHSFLLNANDVCLSSIDTIYQISEKSKKKLTPGQNVSGKINDILIVCKNMRTMEFNFRYSDKDSGKNIVTALLHHVYPKRHGLLFAYDYREPPSSVNLLQEVRLFRKGDDWRRELDRTKCRNWRCSVVNDQYQTSPTMTSHLIVPQSVTDAILTSAFEHFQNRQGPVWVWGTNKGAALIRMADLLPTIPNRTQENILLEHIRKSHPDKRQPHIIYLSKDCPSPKDVQASYYKLRDFCTPDSMRTCKQQDFKFYTLLDNSKWLQYVGYCLTKAAEAAEQLRKKCTVVLQEDTGQDVICIVSCLTQLLLDPYFRTKYGFQSLIQKEWIAMGHSFAYRLAYLIDKDVGFSPIFLLFLDCVFQLLQQFPSAFQISQTYLTTLWDTVQLSIFDTFLFNCEHDRLIAETGNMGRGQDPLILRSAWNWSEQFSDKDIILFCNPLYDDSYRGDLWPQTKIYALEFWSQCYLRWLPNLEIRHGGAPQIDISSRMLVTDILHLQQHVNDRDYNVAAKNHIMEKLLNVVDSFFPFDSGSHQYPEYSSTNNGLFDSEIDTQSVANFNTD